MANANETSNTVAQVLIDGRDNVGEDTAARNAWNAALDYVATALISRGILEDTFVGGEEVRNNG